MRGIVSCIRQGGLLRALRNVLFSTLMPLTIPLILRCERKRASKDALG